MREKIKVLFAAFEATPFIKTGGLGDVAGSLPGAMSKAYCDERVILPKLGSIPGEFKEKMTFITSFRVPLGWRNQYCGLEMLKYKGVIYYFLDNEYYFKRDNAYGYFDDGERIAFFSKAVVESLTHIPDFVPDILHCNDWHTALSPVFLREQYKNVQELRNVKTVFTIHNMKFQGEFDKSILGDILGLAGNPTAAGQLISGDAVNYMMGAVHYSDRITTVSPTYAEEICTPYFGCGLDWLFNDRRDVLSGILNGIDKKQYSPKTDKNIYTNYDIDTLDKKTENKEALQRELGLRVDGSVPMFSLISRLTEQKGLDLLIYILKELLDEDVQLVILGLGDKKYESAFKYYARENSGRMSACLMFDEKFSHKVYAASDILLMPSQFEPCGLSQMIAMSYGTLPLVRETGGLKDSVIPYNEYTGEGTGFSFAHYNAHELLFTAKTAASIYRNTPDVWRSLQKQAMSKDFSWKASAKKYLELYRGLIG